jgi:hypothetical protein
MEIILIFGIFPFSLFSVFILKFQDGEGADAWFATPPRAM